MDPRARTWIAPPPRRDGRPLSRRERKAFARGVVAFYVADARAPSPKGGWGAKPDATELTPPRSTWWRRLLGN